MAHVTMLGHQGVIPAGDAGKIIQQLLEFQVITTNPPLFHVSVCVSVHVLCVLICLLLYHTWNYLLNYCIIEHITGRFYGRQAKLF